MKKSEREQVLAEQTGTRDKTTIIWSDNLNHRSRLLVRTSKNKVMMTLGRSGRTSECKPTKKIVRMASVSNAK